MAKNSFIQYDKQILLASPQIGKPLYSNGLNVGDLPSTIA